MFKDENVLKYYPFEGDETDVSPLKDKMVVGRKEYSCQHCIGKIAVGERHRALTERNNEEHKIMTFRFCNLCCEAMARMWTDGDDSLDDRFLMHGDK